MQTIANRTLPLLIAAAAFVASTPATAAQAPRASSHAPTAANRTIAHARELLGKHYDRSVVRFAEQIMHRGRALEGFVRGQVTQALAARFKDKAPQITRAILAESKRHGFDPLFLLAFIQNESSFNPTVRGSVGEIGLMQITPETAQWASRKFGLPYAGSKTLLDPVANIRLGCAYLAYLRKHFDFHGRLYLAAYNMGPRNVDRALERQIWPQDYASRVMERYVRYYRAAVATVSQ